MPRSRTFSRVAVSLIAVSLTWFPMPALAQYVQLGSKLIGSGGVGAPAHGISFAVSADGDTALVGGDLDNNYGGAAWVFKRTNGVWSIIPDKLVGNGAIGMSHQGASVALSADGATAILGGPGDNAGLGSAW